MSTGDVIRRQWMENRDGLLAGMVVLVFFLSVGWLEIRHSLLPGLGLIGALPGYLFTAVNIAIVFCGLVWGRRKSLWAAYGVASLVSLVLLGTANVPYAIYSLLKLRIFF
ncbi:hypothetical protein C8N35_110156 [Breoghania corrubedonensis]|uniref:Uncharacterized protein n=1 Tax=Breoghania corrubedonensis TaxID=665038 RepID=A0A2T5V1P3_9HYPH|nr:DUF4175 domain-containing protein [Breoghania corrubedonensis]PTW57677.1 hypothetical protein C8N35_110156 [Breoghania corrubedonensis]